MNQHLVRLAAEDDAADAAASVRRHHDQVATLLSGVAPTLDAGQSPTERRPTHSIASPYVHEQMSSDFQWPRSGLGWVGVAVAEPGGIADYSHWGINAIVVFATAVAVLSCVLLHYEALNLLSRWLSRREGQRRQRVLFAIVGMLSAHVVEIWIFAVGSMALLAAPAFGAVAGSGDDLLDLVYLSAMTFTTVGAADAHIAGPIRFLIGTEALTGLVLITWSASFTFLEMERFWRER